MSQAHVGPQLGFYFGSDASFSSLIWRLSIRRSILRHIFKCTLLTLFFPLHCDIPVVDSSRRNFHGLPTLALLGNLNSTRLQRAVEKTYRNLLPQEVQILLTVFQTLLRSGKLRGKQFFCFLNWV
jgi:hypothetical protein